jgi:hypothetical protein
MASEKATVIGIILLGMVGYQAFSGKKDDEPKAQETDAPSLANQPVQRAGPAPIADDAFDPITKASSPKLFKEWGNKGIDRINKAMQLAITKTANSQACDKVSLSGYSFDRSSAKNKTFTIFTDCANQARFYLTEAQATDPDYQARSAAENISAIDDGDAMFTCRDLAATQIRFPSSIDISVWNTSIERTNTTINVDLAFEAKNGFGNMLPYYAHCTVQDDGKTTLHSIKER